MSQPEEWITVSQAAARFGVTPQTIRNWISAGVIKSRGPELGNGTQVDANEIARKRTPRERDQDQRRRPLPPAIFPPPARIE